MEMSKLLHSPILKGLTIPVYLFYSFSHLGFHIFDHIRKREEDELLWVSTVKILCSVLDVALPVIAALELNWMLIIVQCLWIPLLSCLTNNYTFTNIFSTIFYGTSAGIFSVLLLIKGIVVMRKLKERRGVVTENLTCMEYTA
ncbi:uncharacterized protein LOC111712318 [Eurytemora carolleeae]|uniref:uncharacterized protein LOC111712318 n=1 Tax=Eurytemora carolleeae TaxID=1294199 RepID=UPI000C794ADC|nr:uncharacterized protein LOC111712318 [Eurytemora carolleeae]|eukprot:XP_023342661.1 uncharacterized protein LOC111712318 [Eurytemora affinis]